MTVKNPVRFLNVMVIAIRAINAIKRAGGEEGFKFFLNLVGLQQAAAPAKSAVPQMVTESVAVAPTPRPAMPLPADKPERVLNGDAPASKPRHTFTPTPVVSGVFAAKLNGAATQLGFKDQSPLGQFREVLSDTASRGKEYWDRCRELLSKVLSGGLLEEADWKLLTGKMRHNIFFTSEEVRQRFPRRLSQGHFV